MPHVAELAGDIGEDGEVLERDAGVGIGGGSELVSEAENLHRPLYKVPERVGRPHCSFKVVQHPSEMEEACLASVGEVRCRAGIGDGALRASGVFQDGPEVVLIE